MATDVVAIVIFRGEQQPSPVSVQCVNDDGARFVGRVVLWGNGGGSLGRQSVRLSARCGIIDLEFSHADRSFDMLSAPSFRRQMKPFQGGLKVPTPTRPPVVTPFKSRSERGTDISVTAQRTMQISQTVQIGHSSNGISFLLSRA